MVRALGLFSGGLDSVLAACVLREQGIEVTGITFETPFFAADRAREMALRLGVPLIIKDITAEHLAMMEKPKHGFGSSMNPCIDCHALMVKSACAVMREQGFDFVFTGEVLNERPMSQNRQSLGIVERQSECRGYLLRPLSAKLLEETVPEKEGKVDRGRLLCLHGRTRKPQMALAEKYGIAGYLQPAGGCLLTDPGFGRRLKELREHEGWGDARDIRLLKTGRHFRLPGGRKLIVGRNRAENETLERMARPGDALVWLEGIPCPTALLPGGGDEGEVREAARVCARYSDARAGEEVVAECESGKEVARFRLICPAPGEITLASIS